MWQYLNIKKRFGSISGKGFTLLEMLIAIFVITIGIIGTMSLLLRVTASAIVAADRLSAAYLAKEGIEIARNIRDTNWLNDEPWDNGLNCSTGCEGDYTMLDNLDPWRNRFLNINSQDFYGYQAGSPTKFQRKISITKPGSDILEILAEVTWRERGQDYSLSVREDIYKWWK